MMPKRNVCEFDCAPLTVNVAWGVGIYLSQLLWTAGLIFVLLTSHLDGCPILQAV